MIAIIPARAGSKGLPGKNMRVLAGKPLVQHAIDAARDSGRFSAIYVTSDDAGVLALASQRDAIGIERPVSLASDSATMNEVVSDLALTLKGQGRDVGEAFALLQPTSPLRTARHLADCADAFLAGSFKSAVSVCVSDETPQKSLLVKDGVLEPLFGWKELQANRQSLATTYRQNGAIWIVHWSAFHESGQFVVPPAMPFIMQAAVSVDIDDEQDFARAEEVFARRHAAIVTAGIKP